MARESFNPAGAEQMDVKKRRKLLFYRDISGKGSTLGPMMTWSLALFMFPLIYLLVLSFTQHQMVGINFNFTLDNYVKVLTGNIGQTMFNSFMMAVIVTLIVSILAYPYAYFVALKSKKAQSILIFLIMIPSWTNLLLRVLAYQRLMATEGIINSVLQAMGVISAPIEMLYTYPAVYIGMVFTTLPFMILPLYSNLQKIDLSVLEVGRDLGATSFQLFWKVIFPISLPGLSSGVVLVFLPTMANFMITSMLGGKIYNIGNIIESQFGKSPNWQTGSAISVVLLLFCCILIMGSNKLIDVSSHARKKRRREKS